MTGIQTGLLVGSRTSNHPVEMPWVDEGLSVLDFPLPDHLEAGEPPEARGLRRDQVRLMVSHPSSGRIIHTQFGCLGEFLEPGDVLAINTSSTMNAALPVKCSDGTALELHLSTHLPGDLWTVELRGPVDKGGETIISATPGDYFYLPAGGRAQLLVPYLPDQRSEVQDPERIRLWIAWLSTPIPLEAYLSQYGFPIRYKYVKKGWPQEYYQTVYAKEMGSAEMPSAGRAFTPELITGLVANGIQVLPLVLHTGVASLEKDEPPYEEYFRVPLHTAEAVNSARSKGKRVIAVGTTSLRALETVTGEDGMTRPGEGWTALFITPNRRIRSVDGMLTGLHEPRSSHLAMLAALAGFKHIQVTYREALKKKYLWHEFGDLHLILP